MNAACTDEPAIIVVPKTDLDVSVALKAAKNSGLPLRFANIFILFMIKDSINYVFSVFEVVAIATPVTA
jgi:hypothetical protein